MSQFSNLLAFGIKNILLLNFNLCCICSYILLSFQAFLVCFSCFFLDWFPHRFGYFIIFFPKNSLLDLLILCIISISSIFLTMLLEILCWLKYLTFIGRLSLARYHTEMLTYILYLILFCLHDNFKRKLCESHRTTK